jgi:hypothetical protein
MTVFFEGHDEPQVTELVEYPDQVPPFATTVLSGAVHERIATVHEVFAAGDVDHEPSLQVDDTATDEQVAGEVTDEAVYEVHDPPCAVTPQPPDAGHEAQVFTEQVL